MRSLRLLGSKHPNLQAPTRPALSQAVATAVVVILLGTLAAPLRASDDREWSVIDRRAVDGSVVVVPRIVRTHPGSDPFTAGTRWELEPASWYFRVKNETIPARWFNLENALPAVTFRDGEVVENSLVSSLGGQPKKTFRKGEIVHLVDLNAAFKSVRMDLEAVCYADRKRRPQGRAVFVLSGQVGKKTLAEANGAVAQELEPVSLSQVWRHCDPATGRPPFALRTGMAYEVVQQHLGPPHRQQTTSEAAVLDYGAVEVHFADGVIVRLVIPALD